MFAMFNNYKYVNSTAIEYVAYDCKLATLRIVFRSGTVYDFMQVEPTHYVNMIRAQSVGVYFGKNIRNNYRNWRLNRETSEIARDELKQREFNDSLLFANAQRV